MHVVHIGDGAWEGMAHVKYAFTCPYPDLAFSPVS